ncbi:BAM3 [Scenedesmus sp. PABB004]|nr:BAM3 [Scenedesmus sp. PABB004]
MQPGAAEGPGGGPPSGGGPTAWGAPLHGAGPSIPAYLASPHMAPRRLLAERGQQLCGGIHLGAALAATQPLADMRPAEDIPVYVMLPLDTVNAEGVFRYAYVPWFAQALQVLALSGVHGVAVDVWWCAVERCPRSYSWLGYRQLFEMVRGAGLKLQVVLSFHACGGNVGDLARVPLPPWVLEAGGSDPDIFFTDRPRECGLGRRNREYLSIWADDAPVLPGGPGGAPRTPLQAYGEVMSAFRDAFAADLGGLIEEVVVGSGPCGELRYPSYVEAAGWRFPGVGEFQCYDRRALASLAAAAAAAGRPEWGYAGPHDSGGYNSSPGETGFFAPGGSWDSEYGAFFLDWYSGCLLAHGERLLGLANQVFGPHKAPRAPAAGALAQAQAVVRRLQSLLLARGGAGEGEGGGGSSASSSAASLAAVAAAATVAAAAAAGGVGDGDAGTVAAAAAQAKGLLQHVHHLQLQAGAPGGGSGGGGAPPRVSSSTAGSSDDDAGSGAALSPTTAGSGSVAAGAMSACTSAGCLTPQGSLPPPLDGGGSIWEQLASPQAQALASSILAQLQRGAEPGGGALGLMAAGGGGGAHGGGGGGGVGSMPTASSMSSCSAVDLDLAGLLSASQQHLAGLAICGSDGSSGKGSGDLAGGSPRACGGGGGGGAKMQLEPLALLRSCSSSCCSGGALAGSAGAGAAGGGGGGLASISSCSDMSVATPTPLPAPGGAPAAAANGAAGGAAGPGRPGGAAPAGGSPLPACASGGGLAGMALDCAGSPHGATPPGSALLQSFMQALSGLGLDAGGRSSGGAAAAAAPPPTHAAGGAGGAAAAARRSRGLVLTLKIAGVHWWYNSTSHASELTAGYYNTDSRDGYGPILALCERHGVNLTLTCVEMCDAQHPSYALCGPEGLLRQIRAMAARRGVSLSGENALPIFTTAGVDGVALDRVVANVRSCRAVPLRSCSSWPGPATTSDACYGGGSMLAAAAAAAAAQQQQQQHLQRDCASAGGDAAHARAAARGGGYPPPQQQYQQQQQQQQQQAHQAQQAQQQAHQAHAFAYTYGAAMGAAGNNNAALSSGTRTFSELGPLLQQHSSGSGGGGGGGRSPAAAAGGGAWAGPGGGAPKGGGRAPAGGSSSGGGGGGAAPSGGRGEAAPLLPAMRAFTFLRLGPELLAPEVHGSWMRFMHRMLNERA